MSFRYSKYKIIFTHLWFKLLLLAFLFLEVQIKDGILCTFPSFTFRVSPAGISHTPEPSFSISPKFFKTKHASVWTVSLSSSSLWSRSTLSSDLSIFLRFAVPNYCLPTASAHFFFLLLALSLFMSCLASSAFLLVFTFSLAFLLQSRVLFCHI